jgi:hypothetical protein
MPGAKEAPMGIAKKRRPSWFSAEVLAPAVWADGWYGGHQWEGFHYKASCNSEPTRGCQTRPASRSISRPALGPKPSPWVHSVEGLGPRAGLLMEREAGRVWHSRVGSENLQRQVY